MTRPPNSSTYRVAYSLTASTPAESATRDFLLQEGIDVVINVIDASVLSRSLELTLQLVELGLPVVVCLNMMDEAHRKGIHIDRRCACRRARCRCRRNSGGGGSGCP